MAIGDDAASEGYSLVPDTGEDGKVRYGARWINDTRDLIARLKKQFPRKITVSPTAPANPQVDDVWIKRV
ncbi:hypothetical protein [Microbacterium testaceum]|uniref:Uncharacterized protein n=1 Tax=Microbacterium testaceum TaxID=2033 RepID=A0A2T7WPE0_MICTE|nr:hypothetical protein [Microbacterium testaceum]PVE76097.1 hypothetical protein DC432_06590 [Microbacterium testaceum]